MTPHGSDIDRTEQWADWKARFLRPRGERPASSARGLHHSRCSPVMSSGPSPSIRTFSNSRSSNCSRTGTTGVRHTSSSISPWQLLAYFDFPGLELGDYKEVLGGLHHIAISVTPSSGTGWSQSSGPPVSSPTS